MLNFQYRFSDDVNAYITYSRGFKSGLLNGRATEIGGTLEVDPEVLTSYETGVKSRFFDSRLQFNVAAFTNVYRDIQLTVIAPNDMGNLVARIDNAGKAKINGAELEILALPLAGLELNFGGGITAARYIEFDRPGFGNKKLPGTPTYTFNMGAAYTFALGNVGDLRTRVGWSHVGEKGSDVSDPHFNRSPKHGTLSSRISLQMADGVTEIALFGDNLLNRVYIANAVRGVTSSLQYYGAPRTFGLEINRKF
jgi:iron complex outermembrane receptor protein